MGEHNHETGPAAPGPAASPRRGAKLTQVLDAGRLSLRQKLYITRETLLARRGPRRRILFSHHAGWEKPLRIGFQHTRHYIHFDAFNPESVRGYDLVVPLTLDDALYMGQNPGLFQNNPLPIPAAETMAVCDDKVRFHQALTGLGYSAFLPPLEGGLDYPYMLKKKTDQWGQSCCVVYHRQQEDELQALLQDPAYFRQHMVVGCDEYATHMLVKNGCLVRDLNIPYHFNTPTPVKGQDTPVWLRVCASTHRRLFTRILKDLGYEGLCCFNYKHDEKGRPRILEINPRFGGSLSRFFFGFVRDLCRG